MRSNPYIDLIVELQELGYEPTQIEDKSQVGSKQLFLRHDVDVSLECAVQLAELEHDLGVRATYFVAFQSPFFQLDDSRARKHLQTIADAEHLVGLHVDLRTDASESQEELDRIAALIPEVNTSVVSIHARASLAPGLPNVLDRWVDVGDLLEEAQYLSDSANTWREGDPLDHQATRVGKSIHLNTHPVWWVVEAPTSRQKLIDATGLTAAEVKQSIDHWLPRLAVELGGTG